MTNIFRVLLVIYGTNKSQSSFLNGSSITTALVPSNFLTFHRVWNYRCRSQKNPPDLRLRNKKDRGKNCFPKICAYKYLIRGAFEVFFWISELPWNFMFLCATIIPFYHEIFLFLFAVGLSNVPHAITKRNGRWQYSKSPKDSLQKWCNWTRSQLFLCLGARKLHIESWQEKNYDITKWYYFPNRFNWRYFGQFR